MPFKKTAILALLISGPTFAGSISFNTSGGVFLIENSNGNNEQIYKLGNETLGRSYFLDVKAEKISTGNESVIIAITAATGGSGCAEVVSIVTIQNKKAIFSPNLNACGGVKEIYETDGVVTVSALERDESTSVTYKVKGNWFSENGNPLANEFPFLEKN